MNVSPPPARVVFLDIDGVLQPTDSQKRFDDPYRHLFG